MAPGVGFLSSLEVDRALHGYRLFHSSSLGLRSRAAGTSAQPFESHLETPDSKKLERKVRTFCYGSGGGIRTHDQWINSPLLYR